MPKLRVKAAVLCGGKGERLLPLTNFFQKTMIPIGPHRRPLLEYVVRLLTHHEVNKITMLTGYKAEEIENYFGDGSRFGAEINYSRDSKTANGSAGALATAISNGKIRGFDDLIVYYGDILSDLNVRRLIDVQHFRKADATLVLAKGYTLPVGVADVRDGLLASMTEKPTLDISVTTGSMIISKRIVPLLKELSSEAEETDLMRNFIPKLLEKKRRVAAFYADDGFWYDIGTVEKYQNLSYKLVEKHLGFLDS